MKTVRMKNLLVRPTSEILYKALNGTHNVCRLGEKQETKIDYQKDFLYHAVLRFISRFQIDQMK